MGKLFLTKKALVYHIVQRKLWYSIRFFAFNVQKRTDDGGVKFRISSPYRSSERWTESRNSIKPTHVERTRGGDKEKGFQKGRTLRGGRSPPLKVLPFCPQRQSRCPGRSQQTTEVRKLRITPESAVIAIIFFFQCAKTNR